MLYIVITEYLCQKRCLIEGSGSLRLFLNHRCSREGQPKIPLPSKIWQNSSFVQRQTFRVFLGNFLVFSGKFREFSDYSGFFRFNDSELNFA